MGRERSAATPGRRASKSAAGRRRGAIVPARSARKGAANILDGAEPTAEGLFQLQRAAGNQAVASLLARLRPLQRDTTTLDTPAVRKGPSDVDLGFNAMDTAHRLIEAIDQSQLKLLKKGDPGFVAGVNPVARQINFAVVHDQLKGLTASQVKEVEARYFDYEHRALYVDLIGRGQSGAPPNLTVEQIMRLKFLLGGTRAEIGEDPEIAAQHQREADVWELRRILKGDPKGDAIERVMTLVRRSPEESQLLVRLYDGNWNINADLLRMGYANAMRAMMLLSGSHTAADAYAIGQHRLAIIGIDKKIAELDPPGVSVTDVLVTVGSLGAGNGLTAMKAATMASLKAQRKTHVDAIEERVKFTADEARAEAEAGGADVLGIDEAVRGRVSQVLGGDNETERVVGGTQGKLINAIARADPTEQAAAELRKLDERGQLTTEVMADLFRSLRQQAEVEAARLYPDDTADELAEHTRLLSDQWFIHLRTTWDASVVGKGRTFDQLLDRGDQTAVDLKRTLYLASGKLSDVDELVLALRGNRKDLETAKRVLRNKTRLEIDELKRLYKIKTTTPTNTWGGSLDQDLLGFAPSRAGQKDTAELFDPRGKAQGTDRLLIEDYLQRPYVEGGREEVDYVVGRAEREHEYTIANRGATGWWRDHWGNEARSLLDATLKEVREKRDQYYALTKNGTDRKAMRSRDAKLLIREMHFARATIRGDRAGYEKATAELRATFQAIASFVLQAVLTAVLTPAAAALFRGISAAAAATRYGIWLKNTVVSLSSTIAANKAVYGNEYTREMLYADLRGGLSGAIGSAAVGRLVDPIAGRLQSRLGKEMAGEFIEGVKSYGGMQATAALEGEGLVSFDEFAKQHFLGKVGERITGVTAKGLEHVGYGPGPTHAPYVPDEDARARPGSVADGAGGPGAGGHEDGHKSPAVEPDADADVDEAPKPVPMALPQELNKPAPRSSAPTRQDSSPTERTQAPEEPPKTTTPKPVEDVEPANSDIDTKETALTPEMERTMLRNAEMARRAQQHPLDEQSLRASTAPTARTRALATEYAPLFERFKTVTDVVPRSQLIAEIVRRQLAAEGVHEVGVFPADLGEHTGAEFSVYAWQINLNSRTLAVRDLSVQQFSNLVEAAVHEARHALHHWRGLRVALQEHTLRSNPRYRPNADALAAARTANAKSTPEADYSEAAVGEARTIYQQTFGRATADTSGEVGRLRIIAERDARRAELDVAKAEAEKLPAGSAKRQAAELVANSAYKRWRAAYHRYIQLPQEVDAFRRGLAMNAAMVEVLTIPKQDAARQAAREAHADQVTAERRGDKDAVQAAQQKYEAAVEEYRKYSAELENMPHRTGQQRTTLQQDYDFAKEARVQAQKDYLRAKAAGDQPGMADALERFKEAAQEMRNLRDEMEKRPKVRR